MRRTDVEREEREGVGGVKQRGRVGEWFIFVALVIGFMLVILAAAYGVGHVASGFSVWARWITFGVALLVGSCIAAAHAYIAFFHNAKKAGQSISMLPPIGGGFLALAILSVPWGDFAFRAKFAWLAMVLDASTFTQLIGIFLLFRDQVLASDPDS